MLKQFIQNNFTAFATGSLTLSLVSGWMCLSYIQDQQREQQSSLLQAPQAASVLEDSSGRPRSREEVRLQAMVENALQSTWRENMDNASQAQERFMLPGRDHGHDPKFVQEIDERCDKLMKQQQQQQREKRLRKQKQRQLEQQPKKSDAFVQDDQDGKQDDSTRFWK